MPKRNKEATETISIKDRQLAESWCCPKCRMKDSLLKMASEGRTIYACKNCQYRQIMPDIVQPDKAD